MRYVLPLLFGLAGVAVLCGLGLWQVQRLAWKEATIARIEVRIGADPQPLPVTPDPQADDFAPVAVTGRLTGQPLRVLGAWRAAGSGFRIVAPLRTETGRLILADLGVVPLDTANDAAPVSLPDGPLQITGNLNWPDDVTAGTPPPDGDIWYGRDVAAMAETLGTEPVLVVARATDPALAPVPAPVGTEGIPNNHLGYAIQWFGLAAVWAGMTLFLLWRIRRRSRTG